MGNHVYQRYPQLFDAIQALEANDAMFRDVCADYEEICTWLAAQCEFNAIRDPEEYTNARELKRDLEDEILKLLEEYNASIR